MTRELSEKLIDVAMGRIEADLTLENVQIVDVYNKVVFRGCVNIKDGYFASFEEGLKSKERRDMKGAYLVPGLIDGHCHIESSHLSPSAFSDAIVPCGTTASLPTLMRSAM